MALETILPWDVEERLQKLLGNVSLRLLYKSCVHGEGINSMIEKCSFQGSTLTIFSNSSSLFGILIFGQYPIKEAVFKEPSISYTFLIHYHKPTISYEILIGIPKITDKALKFYSSGIEIFSVDLDSQMYSSYNLPLEKKILFGNSCKYTKCEVFRLEGIKDTVDYISRIRKIRKAESYRENLLANLRDYKFCEDLVSEVRILLLGPVGSGKSSFFNSVKSVFQGHVTRQAPVGYDVTSITTQYRIYSIRDKKEGKSLPFILCDTMGLTDTQGEGLCMNDIPHLLKGNVPDRYQFNPDKPITPQHLNYITTPKLKDRIHCVVFVLDINSIDNLSSMMVENFKQIKKEAISLGIAVLTLLTNVGDWNEVLQDDLLSLNKSMISQSQIRKVQEMLDIPICNILMVENYASEWEQDFLKDVLILSAMKQMLRAADDTLEDLPLE